MTRNRNTKKDAHALATARGIKYIEALRILQRVAAGEPGATDALFPTVRELAVQAMSGWLERQEGSLLFDVATADGAPWLDAPDGIDIPPGCDLTLHEVRPDPATFRALDELEYDYADQQLVTGHMEAEVRLAYYPDSPPFEVVLPRRYRLSVALGVLCDRAGELAEAQDVLTVCWVPE